MVKSKKGYVRGRFSDQEKQYIERVRNQMTAQDIAHDLNRTVVSIRNYLRNLPKKKVEKNIHQLEDTAYWDEIVQQFEPDELKSFLDEYRGYVDQFRGEVLHSEQIQILDAIKLGLLASRKIKQEKQLRDDIKRHTDEILKLRISAHKTPEDYKRIDELDHFIIVKTQAVDTFYKAYKDLLDQKSKALKDLKATRGQREDVSISAFKTSFKDWMKRLIEDKAFRSEVGKYAEKHRLAAEEEYERLRQPHTYIDGNQDLPILNSDTVTGDANKWDEDAVLAEQDQTTLKEE